MDFTPHSRLKLDSRDVLDTNIEDDDRTIKTSKNEWLDDHHPFSVLLMPRSLLIFKDQAYSGYYQILLKPCFAISSQVLSLVHNI